MVNTAVCLIALLFQLIAPATWFITKPNAAAGPAIAGHLFTASVFNLLLDNDIIPSRYRRSIPPKFVNFLELLLSLLAMEFGSVEIWFRIEQAIDKLFKCILMDSDRELYESMGGDWLTGSVIIALSLFIFVNTLIFTEQVLALQRHSQRLYEIVQRASQKRNECHS